MGQIILAIDEGTTNAKAICINKDGQILSKGSKPLNVTHPKPAWSEQDPIDILNAVEHAISEALAGVDGATIAGIGISNQRESVLIWERSSGTPLTPVVIWQCRRSQDFCDQLTNSPSADIIQQKSGLPIDPLFPAAKLKWLLDHIENGHQRAKDSELCAGTIDAWLLWNMSGKTVFACDQSNASRTQLFNIHNLEWDDELCSIFDVPKACLPQVLPSSRICGESKNFAGLPDGIPILSQIGDSHAALYGQGGFNLGVIKATYGTGSSLMTPVDDIQGDDFRLAKTVAWNDGVVTYALEGNITHTGGGVDYISKLLGLSNIDELIELASQVDDNNGVYFVPALSGLAAPHWKSKARGLICGLTENAERAHLARASLEAIAYQIADVLYLMEEMSGLELDTLLVDGGPTANNWLMQFQANIINRPVLRGSNPEVSAMGTGYLAGKALGWWSTREELSALDRGVEIIEPNGSHEVMMNNYNAWKIALDRTLLNT